MGEPKAHGLSQTAGPQRDTAMLGGARLNSWKEVARYFERDERTVKRWEVVRGLPIHRPPGNGRSKVYALTGELDAWLVRAPETVRTEKPADAPAPLERVVTPPSRLPVSQRSRLVAGGLSLLAVAMIIVAIASLRLLSGSGRDLPALGSHDVGAVSLLQEGQHAWATRTAAGLAEAKERFIQAIVADPHFARAYSGLAKTLLLEREYANLPDDEAFPQALAAAKRAVQIDPGLAEARAELAFIDFYWLWRPLEAEKEFRTAIQRDDHDVTTRIWFAGMLRLQRRFAEGLDEIGKAQALAPESTQVLITKAMLQVEEGQPDTGDKLLADIELAEPGQMWAHWMRARDSLLENKLTEYLNEMHATLAIRPSTSGTQVFEAAERGLKQGGRDAMLKAELETELRLYASDQIGAYEVAGTYALLDDVVQSKAWLHKAVAAHQLLVLGALSDPILAHMRANRQIDFLNSIILGHP